MGIICWEGYCSRERVPQTPRIDEQSRNEEKLEEALHTVSQVGAAVQNIPTIVIRDGLPRGRVKQNAKCVPLTRPASKDLTANKMAVPNQLPAKARSLGQHAFALQKRQCKLRL